MPLPKAPTKMGEVLKGESNLKTQARKRLKKKSSDAPKSSKQRKVDVNKLVSLAKKPIKKPEVALAANNEKIRKSNLLTAMKRYQVSHVSSVFNFG